MGTPLGFGTIHQLINGGVEKTRMNPVPKVTMGPVTLREHSICHPPEIRRRAR
jgi:hypothetical protein